MRADRVASRVRHPELADLGIPRQEEHRAERREGVDHQRGRIAREVREAAAAQQDGDLRACDVLDQGGGFAANPLVTEQHKRDLAGATHELHTEPGDDVDRRVYPRAGG
jgi:hypothetical protein